MPDSPAPPALAFASPPSVYFCHEPRRIDYEPGLRSTRSSLTRVPYAPLHATERAIDRRGVAAAGRLVTNSEFTATRIQSAYGRTSTPIPLGVDGFFTAAPSPTAGYLLSVGTLIPGKGHDVVIRAAAVARMRRDVVVVARPDPAEHARLTAIADANGVGLDVRVGVSDGDLRDLYRGAFATVQMGAAEPLGLASMEAQACGSPVVVAAEGGLPETIRGRQDRMGGRRDPATVADRLNALGDAALRDRIGSAAASGVRPSHGNVRRPQCSRSFARGGDVMTIIWVAKSTWTPAIRREHALAEQAVHHGHEAWFIERP